MSSICGQTSDAKPQSEEADWFAQCSDEEVYKKGNFVKGQMSNWEPDPKEMVEILNAIDKGGPESIRLDWTCTGRRPLTPSTESEHSDSGDETAKEAAKSAMDFDFDADEDLNTTPTLAASRKTLPGSAQRELKGSARKRTTDYKSILSNIERHRKLDVAEKAAANASSTPKK